MLTGRTGRAQHTQRAPHLVLLAAEPSEEQASQLAELAADAGRLGIGYLSEPPAATCPAPPGSWRSPGTAGCWRRCWVSTSRRSCCRQRNTGPSPSCSPPPIRTPAPGRTARRSRTRPPFLVDITERGRPAVYARLVGPYEIMGLDTPDGERSPLLHEALALLLLHREGVHPRVLASALWPRGATADVRDALIERLRGWLGADPDGTPRLGRDESGRLTLAASVVSDLDVLRTLHHEATEGRGARRASVRERLLTDALALARGPLLADRAEGRYGWLSHELIDAQLPLLVADVALALAAHHVEAGNPAPAIEALNTALATAPADERLWNELLRAVHVTGDVALLRSTAEALIARNEALGSGARGLPPRTEALLDELLPSWRGGPQAAAN